MADSLKYRIPGSEIVELTGSFQVLSSWSDFNGLVLSNFEGTQLFGFTAQDSPTPTSNPFYSSIPFVISKDDYLKSATQLISDLTKNDFNKVILSRVKEVKLEDMNQNELFTRLNQNYPSAFVYSIQSELLGNWVGATPERLIEYKHGKGKTISLAGTKLSSDTEDWGEKEQLEQRYVTQFVESTLNQFATNIERMDVNEYVAGPVKHLITDFNFDIHSDDVLNLALHLHPTPAVSGLPREESLQLIEANEQHERRLYAGIIGVKSASQLKLFVNLRSCQIIDSNSYLYVGGGLTIDSVPELEWQETENKALTILNVLQNK